MKQVVSVKMPATTANMGAGFDCLGMALDIWNTVSVETDSSGFEISGEGGSSLPQNSDNLLYRSFKRIYDDLGKPVPSVRITCHNDIPLGRGLGSSAAAVAGGLLTANQLTGANLTAEELLALAADIEGHPDNAAAAVMGGFQIVVRRDDGSLITAGLPVPNELKAVLFVPDVPMPTEQARHLLPQRIDLQDAVYNLGRVALLVSALATGDLQHLATATQDRLHQPARQTIFYPMKNIFRAAMAAGALGVFLSGAGSSVLALATEREYTVGYEMADAAAKSGVEGAIKVTQPTPLGAHVVQ